MSTFDLDRIRRETFVTQIDYHSEIASTNTHALGLAGTFTSFPTLVLAEVQTAGRGRGANRWWAGEGGLTLSLVLDTTAHSLPSERWPLLSLTVGLAVAEALATIARTAEVRVKWPNDVFLNGRKVCGILVETASRSPGIVVLGIGLNVNNSFAQAPEEIRHRAISLQEAVGETCDRTGVLVAVLQSLEILLAEVRDHPRRLVGTWRMRCYLSGRTVQVVTGPSGHDSPGVTGICQGIADDGALLVRNENGVVRCVSGVVARIE